MVYRLPTHLESFVPPPSAQVPQTRPWRGALIVSGMRASDKGSSQEIRITAVETDGDNTRSRMDLWPQQFFARILHEQNVLHDVQAWVRRNTPPLCTFMADRLRDPNGNTVNQTNFRSLSRILFESQTVVVAGWNSDKIDGAGMIIYPSPNSSALLVGALFLFTPFPESILSLSSSSAPLSPGAGMISPSSSRHHHHYPHPQQQQQQQMASSGGSYAAASSSSSRHHHTTSPHRHPVGQGQASADPAHLGRHGHAQDQYRYIMPRTVPSNYPGAAPSGEAAWPSSSSVKSEDDAPYPPHAHHHHYAPQ